MVYRYLQRRRTRIIMSQSQQVLHFIITRYDQTIQSVPNKYLSYISYTEGAERTRLGELLRRTTGCRGWPAGRLLSSTSYNHHYHPHQPLPTKSTPPGRRDRRARQRMSSIFYSRAYCYGGSTIIFTTAVSKDNYSVRLYYIIISSHLRQISVNIPRQTMRIRRKS